METIITVNPEVDEKEMQISQDCLGVPTILRRILQQFSTKELIELSKVNKLWNFESRSVIKEQGNLRANISTEENSPGQQLVAFGSVLENMRVIPFSGISVRLHHPRACQPISDESLGRSFEAILHRLPWKYFAVSFCGEWEHCKDCPAVQLVETILRLFCGVFEELSLHEGKYEFYQSILKDRWLPCLKTLELKPGDLYTTNEPLTSAFIKGMVIRAPNLQELLIGRVIKYKLLNVVHRSVGLAPTRALRPLFEQVCEDLISSLRVNAMQISIQDKEMDPELLDWFVPMVLAASRTTLKTLYIDLNLLVPLLDYGICLENMTTLMIPLKDEICVDDLADILGLQLPYSLLSRIFPKINQVAILNVKGCNYVRLNQAKTVPGT